MPMVKLADGKHYAWTKEKGKLVVYEVVLQKPAVLTPELVDAMLKLTRKEALNIGEDYACCETI